jgi:hypothetical protein
LAAGVHKEITSYSSPNIVGVIESRRMKRVEHVACIREMRNVYTYRVWSENVKGRDNFKL